MKPHISIIIPVYNGEDSVFISLDSLLKQTYSNFEAVIIDDGSKDNTAEVVHKYTLRDKRFRYTYQPNAGVAMARNKGIELAQGKYICFLDSDDYYDKNFLEEMSSTIERTNTDVCYCGYKIVTPNGVKRRKTAFNEGDILIDYILGTVSVQTTGWMIRRELIQKNNLIFPKGISWGEDFEFFCTVLAQTNKVSYVKEFLTNYRFDFKKDQLSTFSMDKLKQDYESIKRLQHNKVVNRDSNINQALIDYRLSAILTYHLLNAIHIGVIKDDILNYFNEYRKYVLKVTWNNGLRSVKLNLNKLKLLFYLNTKK